jgi:hypothetical protein
MRDSSERAGRPLGFPHALGIARLPALRLAPASVSSGPPTRYPSIEGSHRCKRAYLSVRLLFGVWPANNEGQTAADRAGASAHPLPCRDRLPPFT